MTQQIKWNELTPMQRDALVAEHVMGLRVERFPAMTGKVVSIPETPVIVDDQDIIRGNPAPYTTSMYAAWLVVERITEPPQTKEEASMHANTRFMLWWQGSDIWAMTQADAAESICVAALRSAGVEVVQ